MNYLLLTEYFPESEQAEFTGGVEARCFYFVKFFSKKDNIKVLCSHQPGQKRKSTVFGAEVIRVGPTIKYSNSGELINRLKLGWSFYKQGQRYKNSNIIEGASFLTYLPAYLLGKTLKAKKIVTWHETWVGEWIKNKGFFTGIFGEIWERIALNLKWDQIISVSEFTKKRLFKRKVKCEKIKVTPNGIDLDEFKNIHVNKYKNLTICYFGRVNWQKNLDLLIKSVALIKKDIPNIQCKIIGGGPAIDSLKELVEKLDLNKNVQFTGKIKTRQELLKEAKKCHIFVHPSTLEGFGITVLEAMALELPYVITNIEPFIEVTKNGAGGEIFPKNNIKELTNKIINLIENKEMYNHKKIEGQKLIKQYDWKEIIKKR
jgi:glycosyltransferase involved in cell wall biosynthesis